MIELRLFATLREGRGKILNLEADKYSCGYDIIRYFEIPEDQVSIYLINGIHSKLSDPLKDGDVVAIFPPVGGG